MSILDKFMNNPFHKLNQKVNEYEANKKVSEDNFYKTYHRLQDRYRYCLKINFDSLKEVLNGKNETLWVFEGEILSEPIDTKGKSTFQYNEYERFSSIAFQWTAIRDLMIECKAKGLDITMLKGHLLFQIIWRNDGKKSKASIEKLNHLNNAGEYVGEPLGEGFGELDGEATGKEDISNKIEVISNKLKDKSNKLKEVIIDIEDKEVQQ